MAFIFLWGGGLGGIRYVWGYWEGIGFLLLGNGGDGEGGVLICFCFLYYNDERDERQTLWFALVWKILSKRGWEKEGGIGSMSFS